jgi:hypothetical protein
VPLIEQGKILLIGGGDMDPDRWSYMSYEYFLPKIFDFDENVEAGAKLDEYFGRDKKPYKFLFLNGRLRAHRKYLLERFKLNGVLEQSLWTNLDTDLSLIKSVPQERWQNFNNLKSVKLEYLHNDIDMIESPIDLKLLPESYEAPRFRTNLDKIPSAGNIKRNLFDNAWGDATVDGTAYRDTYFSLVTETVFDYPYSFRTEKIWKPVAMAHPWIAVANRGYYRDMHNLGFRTFGHLIDESFDQIEHSQDRIQRIAQVVEDLCRQDLDQFLAAAEDVCKYNQQHLAHMRVQIRKEFPERFFQFIKKHQFNE